MFICLYIYMDVYMRGRIELNHDFCKLLMLNVVPASMLKKM